MLNWQSVVNRISSKFAQHLFNYIIIFYNNSFCFILSVRLAILTIRRKEIEITC